MAAWVSAVAGTVVGVPVGDVVGVVVESRWRARGGGAVVAAVVEGRSVVEDPSDEAADDGV